jgi:hypothetical protein
MTKLLIISSAFILSFSVFAEDKIEPPKLLKSQKALWIAHVLRDKTAKTSVSDLKLEIDKLPVYLVPQGESFRPLVKLKLKYNKPGWSLFLSDKEPIRKTDDKGDYVVYAYLRSRISTINVIAIGPNRETESEVFYMFAPEAREYKMVSVFDSVYFSVGHSFLNYRQSSFGTFVSQALLVGVKYISPEKGFKLGYFADANLTLYTYKSSPIEENPQFFDARAGLSYLVKVTKNPKYRSRVTLGASTINLFSLGSPFGFSGLYGPNIGYRTEYYKSAKNSFAAEFQIAPYEFSDILSQKTVKLSLDWNRNLGSLRRAQFGLSYANHRFSETIGVQTEKVNADQFNLYFGLSF